MGTANLTGNKPLGQMIRRNHEIEVSGYYAPVPPPPVYRGPRNIATMKRDNYYLSADNNRVIRLRSPSDTPNMALADIY